MIRAVRIDGLAIRRGQRLLFSGLDLRLEAGEALAVTGRNGAGKTSLLRAIAGLLATAAGRIGFEGDDGPLEPALARSRACHYLGHQDGLSARRTAREELYFQCRWTGAAAADALAAADRLGIAGALDLEVRRLSAGQRRRLALCRLLAAPRALWLLDEPFSPLDPEGRALFAEVVAAHLAGAGLVIAAVHDPLPVPALSLAIGE